MPPRRRPGSPDPDKCPPCFNCLLPAFNCGNSGECNEFDGQCRCPPGFGGQDCLTPRKSPWLIVKAHTDTVVCGALTDGDERYPRPDGELCHCKEGWGGINCNGESDNIGCRAAIDFQSAKTMMRVPHFKLDSQRVMVPEIRAMRLRTTWSAIKVDWLLREIGRCVTLQVSSSSHRDAIGSQGRSKDHRHDTQQQATSGHLLM